MPSETESQMLAVNALRIGARAAEATSLIALRLKEQGSLSTSSADAIAACMRDLGELFREIGDGGAAAHFGATAAALRSTRQGEDG